MRILLIFFLLMTSLKASEPKDLDSLEVGRYLSLSNAVVVFTAQDGLSSGVYRFTNVDTEMTMYNLPFQYQFSPLSEKTNLFMILDLGYSNTRSDRDVDLDNDNSTPLLNIKNQLQAYVAGLGIGIRYKATEHSEVQFGGEVLYARLGLFEREGGALDGSIDHLFGQTRDTYSYKILAEYIYHREIHKHKVYARLNYKLYKTFSDIKIRDIFEDVLTLRSQTSVASMTLSYETNPLYSYHDMSFTMEPYLKGNYIWGDMAEVAKINGYATAGLSFYWNTPQKSVNIYRYFIEPSISRGYGIEGLNLGVGFSLDF